MLLGYITMKSKVLFTPSQTLLDEFICLYLKKKEIIL